MNPNLTLPQILARNIFAAQSGVTDAATIELAFLSPGVAAPFDDMASLLSSGLAGPFGNVGQLDETVSDAGYVEALEEIRSILASMKIESENEAHVFGFNLAVKSLDKIIEFRLEDFLDYDTTSGVDKLLNVLSTLIGVPASR